MLTDIFCHKTFAIGYGVSGVWRPLRISNESKRSPELRQPPFITVVALRASKRAWQGHRSGLMWWQTGQPETAVRFTYNPHRLSFSQDPNAHHTASAPFDLVSKFTIRHKPFAKTPPVHSTCSSWRPSQRPEFTREFCCERHVVFRKQPACR